MYGEKAEEAEELKLDLLDVKAMYRSQVIILLCVMFISSTVVVVTDWRATEQTKMINYSHYVY